MPRPHHQHRGLQHRAESTAPKPRAPILPARRLALGADQGGPEHLEARRGRQPMTRQAVNYLLGRIGERARLGRVRPHMPRHSCGFALANRGCDLRLIQDYLGHRDSRHTAHYTRTTAVRFDGLWER